MISHGGFDLFSLEVSDSSQSHSRAPHQFSLTMRLLLVPATCPASPVVLSPPLDKPQYDATCFLVSLSRWSGAGSHSCSRCSSSVLEGPGHRKTAFRIMTRGPRLQVLLLILLGCQALPPSVCTSSQLKADGINIPPTLKLEKPTPVILGGDF